MFATGFETLLLRMLNINLTIGPIVNYVNYFLQINVIRITQTSCVQGNLVMINVHLEHPMMLTVLQICSPRPENMFSSIQDA